MCRHYQILLPLLSLFLVRVDLTDLYPMTYKVQVLEILDGDTVTVRFNGRNERLRLAKIDAPEKGQPTLIGNLDAGEISTKCVRRLVKKNSWHEMSIYQRDIYQRLLGELRGVTLKLVEEGCVGLYPYAQFSSQQEKAVFVRSLMKARAERMGVWANGGYRQPKLWRKRKSSFKKTSLKRISKRSERRQ